MSMVNHSLVSFSIFNSNYAISEDEPEKKIFYYYPASDTLNVQLSHVGFCEAVINFSSTFTDDDMHSIHNEKSCCFFIAVESHFWIILKIYKNPDCRDEIVVDKIFKAMLQQSYDMFKLFNGTFKRILGEEDNAEELKTKMNSFFSEYIVNMDTSKASLLDTMNGIEFFPLDRATYLRIQSFVNSTRYTFKQIKYCVFLYNNSLIWNGIEESISTLYTYIIKTLYPEHLREEIANISRKSLVGNNELNVNGGSTHYGRYILGPKNMFSGDTNIKKVYIDDETLHLVVYRSLGATLVMFIDVNFKLTHTFWKSIGEMLGPQLASLASDINEHNSNGKARIGCEASYIYFNNMNLALKVLNYKNQKLFNVLYEQLLSEDMQNDSQIIVKKNVWYIGLRCFDRQLYIILNASKSNNMIETSDEIQRLCTKEFNRIFTF